MLPEIIPAESIGYGSCCGRYINAHVDEWLDDPRVDEPYAKAFLEHARRRAVDKDLKWMAAHPLFCTFKGERYRVTGASRLGDVWLIRDFTLDSGYNLRVRVNSCSQWGPTP